MNLHYIGVYFNIDTGETMEQVGDNLLEKFLKVAGHLAVEGLDEFISFDGKTDEQKEETLRVCLKSTEIGVLLSCKLFSAEALNKELLSQMEEAITRKDYAKLNELWCKKV